MISWFRTSLLSGLVLLVATLGPGVLAGVPRALSLGSEEEVRHTDSEVVGTSASARFRPPKRGGTSDRNRTSTPALPPTHAVSDRLSSIVISRSLHALQIRFEI